MVIKIITIIVIILFSVLRFSVFSPQNNFQDGKTIRITSKIKNEPVLFPDSQYIRLAGLKIYLPVYPIISYGDKVTVTGIVSQGKLLKPKLIFLEKSENAVYLFRMKLQNIFQKSLPSREGALAAGMTIGTKSLISSDFWQKLKESGTAHVVVASGTNVVLLASFLMGLLAGIINRKKAAMVTAIIIWFYALLCGFDAPIIRAALMGTISLFALETGRIYSVARALIISFILMLIVNPMWLSDAGFWLSFSASLSLIIFSPKTSGLIKKIKKLKYIPKAITEGFIASISAQIGVMPVLLIFFGQISLIAPLTNALVLWTVVPVTAIGALGAIIGTLYFPAGKAILMLVYPLLHYFVMVVEKI